MEDYSTRKHPCNQTLTLEIRFQVLRVLKPLHSFDVCRHFDSIHMFPKSFRCDVTNHVEELKLYESNEEDEEDKPDEEDEEDEPNEEDEEDEPDEEDEQDEEDEEDEPDEEDEDEPDEEELKLDVLDVLYEDEFKLDVPNKGWKRYKFQEIYGHVCVVHKRTVKQGHKSLEDDRALLVIGGRSGNGVSDRIEEIQPPFPPYTSNLHSTMPRPICYHGAVRIGGKIFIIGGSTGSDIRDTILQLEKRRNTNDYKVLKPLPYPVSHMATTVWQDNVVVLGGRDNEGNVLDTAILYNVTTQSYRMLPNMTKKRAYCTAVTIGDKFIVMGGSDERAKKINSAEYYALGRETTWRTFPATIMPRARATAVRCNTPLP